MKINIKKSKCKRLDISSYNNNYYQLPFIIDGCDVIYDKYSVSFDGQSLGYINLETNKFVSIYWLHQDEVDDHIIIDTETMKTKNLWT